MYKNIIVFQHQFKEDDLESKLKIHEFTECMSSQASSAGFVAIDGAQLVTEVSGCHVLQVRLDKKVIPASVLRKAVEEAVVLAEIEKDDDLDDDEIDAIHEVIRDEMLAVAFIQTSYINGYIDPEGFTVVEATSASNAELFVKLVSVAADYKAACLEPQTEPLGLMTSWLKERKDPEGRAQVDDSCVLKGDSASLTIKGMDLFSDHINNHLNDGKTVEKVGLYVEDNLACVIDKNLTIKTIKPLTDIVKLIANEVGESDNPYDAFIANMMFDIDLHKELIKQIGEAFGGFKDPDFGSNSDSDQDEDE